MATATHLSTSAFKLRESSKDRPGSPGSWTVVLLAKTLAAVFLLLSSRSHPVAQLHNITQAQATKRRL